MVPVIALVGRPNVGKSTLFNRLTRSRDALVADFPGLTRDRKYGQADFNEYKFIVIDTGGITGDEVGIDAEMAEQSLLAIEEADVVFFLVDARAGVTPDDQGLANHLRKLDKEVHLVVNKTDGIDADSYSAEFYSLGMGECYQIAAAHGRGVTALIEHVLSPLGDEFPDMLPEEVEEEDEFAEFADVEQKEQDEPQEKTFKKPKAIKLAIVGRPNVGKSTLTNRILGEDRVIVYDMPGTTRDSIYIPMEREGQEYVLIDTAGVRKRKKVNETVEKFSVIKTLKAIEDAHVVLIVIDARDSIGDQDLSLIGFALNAGRSIVIAVNKWDGLDNDVKEQIKTDIDRRLGFIDFARLHFISALHGTGVGHLYDSVQEAFNSGYKKITTSMLTKILSMAKDDHQPPVVRGRRVKLKYAHAGGHNPPRVIIHGNQATALPDSYKRYLMNYFRKVLDMMGTPIRIEFKEGDNPYSSKDDTPTQIAARRRQRLVKFNQRHDKRMK